MTIVKRLFSSRQIAFSPATTDLDFPFFDSSNSLLVVSVTSNESTRNLNVISVFAFNMVVRVARIIFQKGIISITQIYCFI